MRFFERNSVVAGIPVGMNPIESGFESGKSYEQVDLGSRCAVRGLADLLLCGDLEVSHFAKRAANHIATTNLQVPGQYVVFAGPDEFKDNIAYVYERVN